MSVVKRFGAIWSDLPFIKKLCAIAIPIAVQQLLNTTLNFVDTLMIGQLGESTIAAVGLANKVFFVFTIIVFGVVSGTGILAAQYWGKQDVHNIRRAQGIALTIALSVSAVFVVVCVAAPTFVMSIFTNSPAAIKIGAEYLQIVVISYPLTAITLVYVASLRSVNQVKVPVVVSIVAIFTNVILNYVLIFGHFGFPQMGAAGAALATTIARVVECGVLLFIVYKYDSPVAGSIREMLSFDKAFSKLFFKTAAPVIFNEMTWGIGITMYSLAYGRMGDSAMAAITVTQSIEQLAQVVFMGLASACAVILGNELGAGKLKEAKKHALDIHVIQIIFSVLISIGFYFIRMPIISLFALNGPVAETAGMCMIVFCIFMPFKNFNLINVVGVLRSGGDSTFALWMDISGVWLIGVPLAFLGGLVWGLPIYLVYALVLIEEVYKVFIGGFRYLQGKWCRNLVDQPKEKNLETA